MPEEITHEYRALRAALKARACNGSDCRGYFNLWVDDDAFGGYDAGEVFCDCARGRELSARES